MARGLIIGNHKLFKIILVGILKDFLIHRLAPEIPDRMLQDSLIVSPLAAENNVPQHEAKRQADEKLGFDGVEGQRGLRRERALAQGGHLQKGVFDVVGPFRGRPVQRRPVKFVQLGNPCAMRTGC